jgi:aconitase A
VKFIAATERKQHAPTLPGVSTRSDQIVISAQNRNFPGRSGPGQMYLASPLTVAASAVAGHIVEYEPAKERVPALA